MVFLRNFWYIEEGCTLKKNETYFKLNGERHGVPPVETGRTKMATTPPAWSLLVPFPFSHFWLDTILRGFNQATWLVHTSLIHLNRNYNFILFLCYILSTNVIVIILIIREIQNNDYNFKWLIIWTRNRTHEF